MTDNADPQTYEAALSELERIVASMEGGALPLEESLGAYQRGVALLRFCQAKLADAEQRVRVLEEGELSAFSDDDDRS
jgi:exodeoxyribonuclease VII small subunit